MDNIKIKERINEITETFHMKASGLAIAMNLDVNTIRKNKSDLATKNKFNQKNLDDLTAYIKTEASKL